MNNGIYIVVVCLLLASCGGENSKIYPKKVPLTESVYASATVQPDSLYQAYSAVIGILDQNLVQEGEAVKKGEAVLQISNTSPKLNMRNAELAWRLAKKNYQGDAAVLTGIHDEIKASELKLQNDSINYFRQKNLWEQNIGSKVEFDNRKLAYELSQSNTNLLKRKYERTKNELQTQLQQAENNYKSTSTVSKDFTVSSKIDGTVYALYKNPGEIVNTMEPVAAIGKSKDFVVELQVDEIDIVKLEVGQKILITLDAYQGEVFEARLRKIFPRKDERSQTFKIEAIFNQAPAKLYPGLSGEGNIIVAEKKEALTIPKSYLIRNSMVKTEDGEVEVTIGLQTLDSVEILEGIDEKTALLKPEQ
ncbi:MAG: HlyD family efflux transporter periplasmic adaptor subunit [Croceitalea sp.]|nr:HlyD family efflux transporter periplasmic adaptor subunit [Croceitalea sp.]